MVRMDSDLLGILLALLTFVLPAVSAFLEKRRKEKRRGGARMLHAEPSDPYPDKESSTDAEGLHVYATRQEMPPAGGDERDAPQHMQEEDVRAREIEELFEVLLGVQKKPAQEEPVHVEPVVEEIVPEVPVEQLQQVHSGQQEELFEEAVPAFGEALREEDSQPRQQPARESGADVPAAGKSLKERLKEHPEDMVLFAEIMKPKFKEF